MEFRKQVLHFCENISSAMGVYCTLLNMNTKCFYKPPFRYSCVMENGLCTANEQHCTGCKEATRWNGRYMYNCRKGFTFIATSLRPAYDKNEYGLITGPFILSDDKNMDATDEPLSVPQFTKKQAVALDEIIYTICKQLANMHLMSSPDSNIQEETIQTMYSSMHRRKRLNYLIEDERRLQHLIRNRNKKDAQKLLNVLLLELYSTAGTDFILLKARIRDIITLMSRAATDSGADINEIFQLCDRSTIEIEHIRDFDTLDSWLAAMLHRFFDLAFRADVFQHSHTVQQVSDYIRDHLTERLSLDQVAEEVHISKSYLCRILKKETNCTFTEYINRLRIEQSKIYLRSSSLTISEIARAVGFDDQSYFTRVFKRLIGTPPGKYRTNL